MSFGSFEQGRTAPMAEINTTPLVDVMLVLLVVFIVTAPLLTHAVPIQLPQENAIEHHDTPNAVNLSVDQQGKIFWNDQMLSEEALEKRLATAMSHNPQMEVHLRADKHVTYEHVAAVMAAAQRSGVQRLGFVTEAE